MTKILNFALKIKGGGRESGTCEVLRPCHPPKKNLERAPNKDEGEPSLSILRQLQRRLTLKGLRGRGISK